MLHFDRICKIDIGITGAVVLSKFASIVKNTGFHRVKMYGILLLIIWTLKYTFQIYQRPLFPNFDMYL